MGSDSFQNSYLTNPKYDINATALSDIERLCKEFSDEREQTTLKLEKHRQKVIRSRGKLNFDDAMFNKLLDKMNKLNNELEMLECLKTQFRAGNSRREVIDQAIGRKKILEAISNGLKPAARPL